jgi:serine phosphatase RsbU (regulator of sigma subunit)
VQLQKNDLLFLYTDGWIETKRYGASFNRSRLVEMIGKLPPEASSKQVLTALEKALLAEDESTEDDRTALVFRHL